MKVAITTGTILALSALLGVMFPSNVMAWGGTEGCTPGYWKNNADTNPRIAELDGISLRAALLVITGIDLDFIPTDLTLDEAVNLQGGGENAFMRHAAAAVYNIWYGYDIVNGVPLIDYVEPNPDFTNIVQMAADGDVEEAKDLLDAANNAGCPIDAFGNRGNEEAATVSFSAHWFNQDGPGTPVCEDEISGSCGPFTGSASKSEGVVTGTWLQIMPRGALCTINGEIQELTTDGNTFELLGTYEGSCSEFEIGSPIIVSGECGIDSEISFTIGGTENRFVGDSTCSTP